MVSLVATTRADQLNTSRWQVYCVRRLAPNPLASTFPTHASTIMVCHRDLIDLVHCITGNVDLRMKDILRFYYLVIEAHVIATNVAEFYDTL